MITEQAVSRVLNELSSLTSDEVREMAMQMSEEQPFLQAYLLAACNSRSFREHEVEIFFFVGVLLWQVVRRNTEGAQMVTDMDLEDAENANELMLQRLNSESPGDFLSAGESLVVNYPEPELLRYMVRFLMEDETGNPDNPPFGEENLGVAFFHLKVVMDALLGIKGSLYKA